MVITFFLYFRKRHASVTMATTSEDLSTTTNTTNPTKTDNNIREYRHKLGRCIEIK